MPVELDPLRPPVRPRIDGSSPENGDLQKLTAPNSQTLAAQSLVPPSPTSDRSLSLHTGSDTGGLMECDSGHSHPLELETDTLPAIPATNIADLKNEHVADIAALVSLILTDLVRKNDGTPFSSDKLTRFHSRAPPQISIHDYIMRIVKFCKVEKAMLLVCIYLATLFAKSYPNFVLNSLTVHRFLITAVTVATKGLCDQFCSNTLYARVGGLSVLELNLLEVEFLVRVQYRVVPPMDALISIYENVQAKRASPDFVSVIKSTSQPLPKSLTKTEAPAQLVPPNQVSDAQTDVNSTKPGSDPAELAKKTHKTHLFGSRKHPREGQTVLEHKTNEETQADGQPRPPGKPSGNKGLKAVKDTFKFLHSTKKK